MSDDEIIQPVYDAPKYQILKTSTSYTDFLRQIAGSSPTQGRPQVPRVEQKNDQINRNKAEPDQRMYSVKLEWVLVVGMLLVLAIVLQVWIIVLHLGRKQEEEEAG